jgi:hypothetical protein
LTILRAASPTMMLTLSLTPARSKFAFADRGRGPGPFHRDEHPVPGSAPRARSRSSRCTCRFRGCGRAPTDIRQHAQQRADLGVHERQVLCFAVAGDFVEHGVVRRLSPLR